MNEIQKKLGALLKLERENQKISLEDMAIRLKLSETNLSAVESGDPKHLPSELYYNLFTKSYCEALGIDFSRTKEAIGAEIEQETIAKLAKPAVSKDGSSDGEEEANSMKKLAIIFGSIVGLFAIVLIIFMLYFNKGDQTTQDGENAETVEKSTIDADQAKFAAYDWNVPGYEQPQEIKLQLTARSASWATVLADGDTAIFRSLVPGRVYEISAKYRLKISVGVPRFVKVELNGQEVNLADPESRRISKVYIDQMNLSDFLTDQTDNKDMESES